MKTSESFTLENRGSAHLADKDIPQQMGIGLATVRTHMRRMFGKLDVHSRAEALRKYLSGQIGC